jgi:hypothetical protein
MVSNLADAASSEDVLRFFHGYGVHAKSVTFVREHQVRLAAPFELSFPSLVFGIFGFGMGWEAVLPPTWLLQPGLGEGR